MMKSTSAIVCLLLVGCASTPTESWSVSSAPEPSVPESSAELAAPAEPAAPVAEPVADPLAEAVTAPTPIAGPEALDPEYATWDPSYSIYAPPPAASDLRTSRFTLKGGYYGSSEDNLDNGWIANVSWMRFFTRFFALELEAGYFDAKGEGVAPDLFGVPLMVNGRLNIPVWVLDLYGGLGIGTIYYDFDEPGPSDWVLAGNAFLGATINLADALSLGLEGKYYLTDDVEGEDGLDTDEGLDAFALMLTLGWSR